MLVKDTVIERQSVTQEIRCILDAADEQSLRHVQVLIPMSPDVFLATSREALDAKLGPNRTYKMPPAQPGATLAFWLRPGQKLFAASKEGVGHLSIIVEFHDAIPGTSP